MWLRGFLVTCGSKGRTLPCRVWLLAQVTSSGFFSDLHMKGVPVDGAGGGGSVRSDAESCI